MPSGFSIIICTHNPKEEIIFRLFNAVLSFDSASPQHEVIIVDNNSTPALEGRQFIIEFLGKKKSSRLILETKSGLTSARIAGINAAQYDWIIFFDDDNEPAPEYLLHAEKLIKDHSNVACWGAGGIHVNFLARNYDPWLNKKKWIFQERKAVGVAIYNDRNWRKDYPVGTGLICQRDVLLKYKELVKEGKLSLTDRKGKSLSSGGDVQIILLAIKLGYAVGISELLQLNHNISEEKTSFRYISKLLFGMASSYTQAFNQVFDQFQIPFKKATNILILMIIINHIRFFKTKIFERDALLRLSNQLGEVNSVYMAYPNEKRPFLLRKISSALYE